MSDNNKKKEFAEAACDHHHDICDDCLLIYFPFKLMEEELEEIKAKARISRKDFELMQVVGIFNWNATSSEGYFITIGTILTPMPRTTL